MQAILAGAVLLVCLSTPLMGGKQRPRKWSKRLAPESSAGAPLAVGLGSWAMWVLMFPVLRVGFTGTRDAWIGVALLVLCVLIARLMVRMVAPARLKGSRMLVAARTVGLCCVVAGVMAPLDAEVDKQPMAGMTVIYATTAAVLGLMRIVDHGYFPLVVLRKALWKAFLAVVTGYWIQHTGGTLVPDPDHATAGTLLLAVLWWSLVVLSAGCAVAAAVRLVPWLRAGPPAHPAPPGVTSWPPAIGDVWTAELNYDDNTYKERPVVVLERTPGFVRVLGVTSVDQSARRRAYLKLRLPEWEGVLTKDSWLNLEIVHVPYSDFLWRRGECPGRVWDVLCTKADVRERSAKAGPAPGFTFRYRLRSAMNAHVGRDARVVRARADSRVRRVWAREKV
ncbi:hypothetical protein AB0945_13545 [Streptomyces sp. NPDC005474]|uniref:hypothetical protein n=1 Tax=Streptomyces sp. NPDC005474 TaxID=3154878 RepID=UPI00345205F4